jgi:hypothetical protein
MLDPNRQYTFFSGEVAKLDLDKTYTFGPDTEKLYNPSGPDLIDTGMIIGLEVVPAIVGGLVGAIGGPKGVIGGGAAGSALGNFMSQNYRINRGFQEDLGLAELGAATALGAIPSVTGAKALKNIGGVTRTGIRSAEGAGLATGEMLARTYGDEGRAPTREEIATTVLFGGTFGGGLGALEAKWLGKNLVEGAEEGMTRPELLSKHEENIKEAGGIQNLSVGTPLLEVMDVNALAKKSPKEAAEESIQAMEDKLLDESEGMIKEIATGEPSLTGPSLTAPTMSRGALESFDTPTPKQSILGGPSLDQPTMPDSTRVMSDIQRATDDQAAQGDALVSGMMRQTEEGQRQAREIGTVKQMSDLQKTFDEQLAQDDEIFTPLMREVDLSTQQVGDNARLGEIQQGIAMLDHKHGKNKGASNQRKKLNAEKQRILRRNNMVLDDLEAQMQGRQMPPNRQDMQFGDQPMKQADPMTKSEQMAEDKLGPGYEKYFNIAMGAGGTGIAGYSLFANEEDSEQMAQAGVAGPLAFLLTAIGFKGKSLNKFLKTKKFKKINNQAKRDPQSVEPTAMKSQRVANAASRDFAPKRWWSRVFEDVRNVTSDVLTPISRQIKNLDKKLGTTFTEKFRNLDLNSGKKTAALMKGAMPFMKSMSNALKGKPQTREKFDDLLLEGDFEEIVKLIDRLKLPDKASDSINLELKQMRETLEEIRTYAREEGGFDVGYIENYFPRKVKNYKELRDFMDNDPELRAATTEIDKAIDEFAAKNKISREELTPEELAEVTSRVIRGYPVTGTIPSNFNPRSIFDKKTLNKIRKAYESPEDALESYIRGTVDAVERKKFLGAVKPSKGQGVQGEGFRDTMDSDIGMRAKVDESLAAALAQDLLKGTKFGQEDVEKLRQIIQSRFSGGTENFTTRALKNLGYLQVMTNFGSAITQLTDQVFSIHFNGFGNHFKTLFNRKDMFNFAELTGLSQREFEDIGNSDKLSGLLDNLFRKTGLKQLDLFAKNAYMNAAWRKYHKLAQSEGGSQKLREELLPYFGERTDGVIKAVRSNAPTNKEPPAEVTELVFHKLLDVAPATATEVPASYMRNPNMRIMYMLKTFTIKQIDTFRTAGISNITEGGKLYMAGRAEGNQSKQEKGVRLAAKGTKDLVQIAALFATANAGTDVIKDVIYGRPINADETLENSLLQVIGINRYHIYNAKRKGPFKAGLDYLAPPTAFFDRAFEDISAIAGDGEYKGAMLQGTPLDLVYWRYLGGLDKVKD